MKWSHRMSVLLACATLGLIYIGGLVTSTHSALAVPDWPLSYGRLMPRMVGGILFEHGHRMVAGIVAILTFITAVVVTRSEHRSWLKKAAWGAFFLVIVQAILGGLTVLFRLPWFTSVAHATLAQTFFSLTVALAVWSSPAWASGWSERREPENTFPLHHLSLALTMILFLQLIFGAVVRHTGVLFSLHITGAVLILILSIWIHLRIWQNHSDVGPLRRLSMGFGLLVIFQIVLGLTSYTLLVSNVTAFSHPLGSAAVVSMHVALGAAILGISVILTLISYKTKPSRMTPRKTKLADYLELTKPGISFMAGITALAGFVLGSKGDVVLSKLIHTTVGTLMIAGGAGVLNMLIEKDSDARMKRTQKRPIPAGRMQPGEALFIGSFLSVLAIVYLSWAVNTLTAVIAGLTLCIYLYVYTPLKKVTSLCTVVGAVAGALPPVIGWAAATGGVGPQAWILFGIIFFWQFPHFFSLAWIYKDDYAQGGLHMLPVRRDHSYDAKTTAFSILINSVGLLVLSVLPTLIGLTGHLYLVSAVVLSAWMLLGAFFFYVDNSHKNARKLFFASLAYVPLLVVFMLLNRIPAA